ncbi:MAG: 3D domain-containing protein [Candidatus Wildermuthbacteria bacterium]|nr:3D domain-containing protein [Candidatus Wildermuthbacteria bacterium]
MKQSNTRNMLAGIAMFGTLLSPAQAPETAGDPSPRTEIATSFFQTTHGEELIFSQGALVAVSLLDTPKRVERVIHIIATGYSSTPEQTDDTPFITASGTLVRDGIVAANFLPFGTKIRLPEVYGEKVFVVEDRMHPRKQYMVDVWFSNYEQAKEFGAKDTHIEVLED